jgi:selenocysteine-specific elongation factor
MGLHVLATAGHVDHGKSTLVKALTGMEPDRLAEERRRGMTLDLGFAWTRRPGGDTIAFVDVPGHERFVPTMLAGVGPVPAVLMVVAADEGWMPQSAEHLDAVAALGVRHGLLAVTRSDLADPGPALADAAARLAEAGLGGDVTAPGVEAVAVSARTGAGLDELRAALDRLVARLPSPAPDAPVRFWVDRAFTVRGAGTVVTGTLPAGTVRAGDRLRLAGRSVTVRGLHSMDEPVPVASGVARVALNLRSVPLDAVGRGQALVTDGAFLEVGELDGRLHGVRGEPVDAGALPTEVTAHVGSAAVPARVRPLGPDVLRLRLARPLPLRIGDRLVLRDPGAHRVCGGLIVLDVRPPALRRRGAAARRASSLATVTGVPDAGGELARRRLVRADELVAMGVPAADVDGLDAVRGGGWLLDPAAVPDLRAALADAVTRHDAADPLEPGLPLEAARHALDLPHPDLVTALVSGDLVVRDGRVRSAAAASGVPGLPEPIRAGLAAIRADLDREPFAAPEAGRLAELGLGPRELAALVRAGELVAVADGVVLLPGAPDQAVRTLRGLDDPFTLSAARQALGTTRRVAVPLLELLARTGRTRRTEDGRHRVLDPSAG